MKYCIAVLSILFSALTQAEDVARRDNLEIKTWHPSSINRVNNPKYNGVVRLYFTESGAWGNTSCRQDAADITNEDTALISSMLSAFMANKKMKVEINASLGKIDNVCKITAAFIAK